MKKCLYLLSLCLLAYNAFAEPLPAKDVFQVSVQKIDPNTFSLKWQIKDGYFLYSERIKLDVAADSTFHLGLIRFPEPSYKKDKQNHNTPVYRNTLSIPVAILGEQAGESLLNLHYQGCADDGFCYPPEVRQIKIAINNELAIADVSLEPVDAELVTTEPDQNSIEAIFANHNWAMIFLIFYGFGLLLSFTPCILPMVPVLSGIIVGHGETVTTRKAFFLSLSYVLSMSVTYAVVGLVVALLGANIQVNMQSPWVISAFSLLFILLALSMFGFYELQLPASWQAKIAGSSRSQRGGHYWGAAIMGCLSTLIISPCVTAPLIGVLTYIAQSKNLALGAATLFFLSLGMGTPLLLIGTSAGKLLPRAGSWMNTIKSFFGLLFIVVAIVLMGRILPPFYAMASWAVLLIFTGVYIGALTYSPTIREKLWQATGIVLLSYGLFILVGMSMGGTDPLYPLARIKSISLSNSMPQQSLNEIKNAISNAKGKPIMLDFYADWCSSCKVMEATTFQDKTVNELLSHFAVIKVDVTRNDAVDKEILQYFHVVAPPTFVFFDADGQALPTLTQVGELSAEQMSKVLKKIVE